MKAFISLIRPRTLPLIICAVGYGVLPNCGNFISLGHILLFATAIFIQIFSNIANDYGDYKNGADAHREDRMSASGKMSLKWVRFWLYLFGIIGFVTGIFMLYLLTVFTYQNYVMFFVFLGLGILCLLAAYFYTAGKIPYGYKALGDVSVFLFFGIVGVVGTHLLSVGTHCFSYLIFLPAIGVGCFAVSVLNINNMRDIETDMEAGKVTIANKLGKSGALKYQAILYIITILSMLSLNRGTWISSCMNDYNILIFLIFGIFLFLFHKKLAKADKPMEYTTLLKQSSVVFFVCYLLVVCFLVLL